MITIYYLRQLKVVFFFIFSKVYFAQAWQLILLMSIQKKYVVIFDLYGIENSVECYTWYHILVGIYSYLTL